MINICKPSFSLKDAGLQINFNKSLFGQTKILFLGHVISKEGLRPSPDHLPAISEAPTAKDMPELRSVMRLNFLVQQVLAKLCNSGGTTATVTSHTSRIPADCCSSFNKLKTMLLKSPVLSIYDPKLATFITTDASDYGLGAVLTQLRSDNMEHIVAFTSCTLSAAKKNSTVEK